MVAYAGYACSTPFPNPCCAHAVHPAALWHSLQKVVINNVSCEIVPEMPQPFADVCFRSSTTPAISHCLLGKSCPWVHSTAASADHPLGYQQSLPSSLLNGRVINSNGEPPRLFQKCNRGVSPCEQAYLLTSDSVPRTTG